MAKEIRCDNCDEVIIVLSKGSKVKPDIYAVHEQCPTSKSNNPVITPEVGDLMKIFGIK